MYTLLHINRSSHAFLIESPFKTPTKTNKPTCAIIINIHWRSQLFGMGGGGGGTHMYRQNQNQFVA